MYGRPTILTVTQLTAKVRSLLESTYKEVWVRGEITHSFRSGAGHIYFDLTDGTNKLKAVVYRSAARRLRFMPEKGVKVIACGQVSLYGRKSECQIACTEVQPDGQGALQLAFQQLKKKLDAEGLTGPSRKRRLPTLPRQIGIVTSADGAAIRDILRMLSKQHPNYHVVLSPARVQGPGAAREIAAGVRALSREDGVDVIIVGRGGGSAEDLWAFNEEPVARAIAAARVPVISAVGHDTDVTISDAVADVRAATPSAAAELAVAGRRELIDRVDRSRHRLLSAVRHATDHRRTRLLETEQRPGLAGWPARVAMTARHVSELTRRLETAGTSHLKRHARELRGLDRSLKTLEPRRRLSTDRARLRAARSRLNQTAQERINDFTDRKIRLAQRLSSWPQSLTHRATTVADLTSAAAEAARAVVRQAEHRVRDLRLTLETRGPRPRIEAARTRLTADATELHSQIRLRRQHAQHQLGELSARLESLSPLGVLTRGYSICWRGDSKTIIHDTATVQIGEEVIVRLRQGRMGCTVTTKDDVHG